VLDPTRRLAEHYKVFNDDSARYPLRVREVVDPRRKKRNVGRAVIAAVDEGPDGVDIGEVLSEPPRPPRVPSHLRRRAAARDGVSMFLEAKTCSTGLQIAIAPLLIGDGPSGQSALPPRMALSELPIARATACSAWASDVLVRTARYRFRTATARRPSDAQTADYTRSSETPRQIPRGQRRCETIRPRGVPAAARPASDR